MSLVMRDPLMSVKRQERKNLIYRQLEFGHFSLREFHRRIGSFKKRYSPFDSHFNGVGNDQ